MLVAIVNHEHTEGAQTLRSALAPLVDVFMVDSGSSLRADERPAFDLCLGNVYYSRLMNLAHDETVRRGAAVLLFVCSDIAVKDAAALVVGTRAAFADPDVALYAPCMNASPHPHMQRHRAVGLRAVPFVEGACFAVRAGLLAEVCPIDAAVNALGWGVDVALGYHAWRYGLRAVVDDGLRVVHGGVCGYDRRVARTQRDAWFAQQAAQARRFRWATAANWVKSERGWRWVARFLR